MSNKKELNALKVDMKKANAKRDRATMELTTLVMKFVDMGGIPGIHDDYGDDDDDDDDDEEVIPVVVVPPPTIIPYWKHPSNPTSYNKMPKPIKLGFECPGDVISGDPCTVPKGEAISEGTRIISNGKKVEVCTECIKAVVSTRKKLYAERKARGNEKKATFF